MDNATIPQWQRRELQSRLRTLQRSANTAVRKLEIREVTNIHTHTHVQRTFLSVVSSYIIQAATSAQSLLEKNGSKDLQVDSVNTDSLSVSKPPTVHQY